MDIRRTCYASSDMPMIFRRLIHKALQWILHYPSFGGLLQFFVDNLASLEAKMGIEKDEFSHLNNRGFAPNGPFKQQRQDKHVMFLLTCPL